MPDFSKGKLYILKNTKNDKVYIGHTTETLEKRLKRHFEHTKGNFNYSMREPIQEIGEENFYIELLEEFPCQNKKELEDVENYWINFFIEIFGKDNVYNKMINNKHSQETKQKISNALKGKILTEEHKKKLSKTRTGKRSNNFNRGSIRFRYNNMFSFDYWINDGENRRKTSKSFNINKYGSKENALKALKEFQNEIYPIDFFYKNLKKKFKKKIYII